MSVLFKRNAWDSRNPPSHSAMIPSGFHSQNYWELLFPALELLFPQAWDPHKGLDSLLLGGTSPAEISLLILICHM